MEEEDSIVSNKEVTSNKFDIDFGDMENEEIVF